MLEIGVTDDRVRLPPERYGPPTAGLLLGNPRDVLQAVCSAPRCGVGEPRLAAHRYSWGTSGQAQNFALLPRFTTILCCLAMPTT